MLSYTHSIDRLHSTHVIQDFRSHPVVVFFLFSRLLIYHVLFIQLLHQPCLHVTFAKLHSDSSSLGVETP